MIGEADTLTALAPLQSKVLASATTDREGTAALARLGKDPVFVVAALPGFRTVGTAIEPDPECLQTLQVRLDAAPST